RPGANSDLSRGEPEEAGEEPDEGNDENHAPKRREAPRQSVEDRAARADESSEALVLLLDRLAMVGDEHFSRFRPFGLIETRCVADLQRLNGIAAEVQPVLKACHSG